MAAKTAQLECAARRHIHPASPDADRIAWFAQTHVDSARVEDWSCVVHDRPEYELCVIGAVWFIRRRNGRAIHETHREPPAVMLDLWERLRLGAAR